MIPLLLFLNFAVPSVHWRDGEQTPSRIIYLGVIKGEISKVSDGGKKFSVKYKELITTSRTITGIPRRSSSKLRTPPPKELVLKEKNETLELRLHEEAVIRILDSNALDSKSDSKRKTKSTSDDEDADTHDDEDSATQQKNQNKSVNKSGSKKTSSLQLPGKAGTAESLAKGQIALVSVAREDLPGYSRLIATAVYILGEK
ncbi:MAG TPA: hypothetical protein PKA06_06475 [Gemmatales bacterium]|nr:hypothetical protein [Gemmatales bacterium]